MNEPHNIDYMLMQRAAPKTPHDLADRILYRASRTPQVKRSGFSSFVGECLSLLMIPRPALAFSLCLTIGVFSGWVSTQSVQVDDSASTQVLDLVVIEEDWI